MDSFVCSICMNLFMKPVTLPCGHEFCLDCLKVSVDEVSLLCPVCRKRISTWLRKRTLDDSLVNEQKWSYITENFQELVEVRLNDCGECFGDQETPKRLIYSNGELRTEYINEMNKMKEERMKQIEKEEKSSLQLIQTIMSASNDQLTADEMFARQLQEEQSFEKLTANKYNFRRRKYIDYYEGRDE